LRIGLLSDTHGFLDDAILEYFANCDEIWHAGDFGTLEILHHLAASKTIRGVYGNVDGHQIRAEVPKDLNWECEGLKVFMTHIGGYPGNYDARVKRLLPALKPSLFICGHSHILKVMRDPALNMIHMNPGAAGHVGWHTMRTILRFEIDSGKISAVQALELGPRGRSTTRR
jgi:putative phosphoesterase